MDKLKAYIPLFLLIAAIYVGLKVVPPYFNSWQFTDFCESEARMDTYNTKPEAEIKRDVMRNARDNDIPVTEDMVTVRRMGSSGVFISTHYTVHIDVPVHPFDLDFSVETKNVNPVTR
jgi:hypothetical protein